MNSHQTTSDNNTFTRKGFFSSVKVNKEFQDKNQKLREDYEFKHGETIAYFDNEMIKQEKKYEIQLKKERMQCELQYQKKTQQLELQYAQQLEMRQKEQQEKNIKKSECFENLIMKKETEFEIRTEKLKTANMAKQSAIDELELKVHLLEEKYAAEEFEAAEESETKLGRFQTKITEFLRCDFTNTAHISQKWEQIVDQSEFEGIQLHPSFREYFKKKVFGDNLQKACVDFLAYCRVKKREVDIRVTCLRRTPGGVYYFEGDFMEDDKAVAFAQLSEGLIRNSATKAHTNRIISAFIAETCHVAANQRYSNLATPLKFTLREKNKPEIVDYDEVKSFTRGWTFVSLFALVASRN